MNKTVLTILSTKDKLMKTLLKLYSFESVHGSDDEKALADWIDNWLTERKIPHKRLSNNIYSFDYPDTPCLSAHIDQVKTNGKAVHFYLTPDKHITGYNADWQRTSLGGDDKNGVWIILKLLEKGLRFNFILSEGEERGCIGINKIDLTPLKEIDSYCIVLDRRGSKDILKSGGGSTFCSTLAQCLCNFLGNENYAVTTGSVSDTCRISEFCESVNMSVAYEAPHTDKEHTNWTRLEEILEDVESVLQNFVHFPTPPSVYQPSYKPTKVSTRYRSSQYDEEYYKNLYPDYY